MGNKDLNKPIAVLILAAGYSSRMQAFKPLLPVGNRPAMIRQIETLRNAGLNDIRVVTGFQEERLRPLLERENVQIVSNPAYDQGMFSSIQCGVKNLNKERVAGFFLLPVDYPMVTVDTYRLLRSAIADYPDQVIIPCFRGKGGHPPFVPAVLFSEILAKDNEFGIKSVFNRHHRQIIRLETEDEGTVLDMDTRKAYEEIQIHEQSLSYPDYDLCLALYDQYETPLRVRKHCNAVTRLTAIIGRYLNAKGAALDLNLLQSAAMLHDLVRIRPSHAAEGAAIIEKQGYSSVADLIREHMTHLKKTMDEPITELDLLSLVDKMIKDDQLISLAKRRQLALDRFSGDQSVAELIRERFAWTFAIEKRIEEITGVTIEAMWEQCEEEYKKSGDRRIFLIRHGLNRQHDQPIFLGQTDLPLAPEGLLQARQAAEVLWTQEPNAERIYSSDLLRAKETAKIIAEAGTQNMTIPVIAVPEFRELALGAWDGLPIEQIKKNEPEAYQRRGHDLLRFKIDPGSENFYDLRYRVLKKLNEILNEGREDLIIVSHAGVFAVIISELTGADLALTVKNKKAYGSVTTLKASREFRRGYDLAD